jgi:hypothetical protein
LRKTDCFVAALLAMTEGEKGVLQFILKVGGV